MSSTVETGETCGGHDFGSVALRVPMVRAAAPRPNVARCAARRPGSTRSGVRSPSLPMMEPARERLCDFDVLRGDEGAVPATWLHRALNDQQGYVAGRTRTVVARVLLAR